MAESHTYLNYVHINNALVTNYYQSEKGERGTEKYVLSESEMGLIVNVTCVEAERAAASESAIRGKDSINHIPWYDM